MDHANDPSTLADAWLWSHFKYFELDRVERQLGDQTFVEALNQLRIGKLNAATWELFTDRVYDENYPFPEDALHLFRDNDSVDRYNEVKLQEKRETATQWTENFAVDLIAGNLDHYYKPDDIQVAERKQMILTDVRNFHHSETGWLQYRLNLVVGARYMVTINVATADGIVNGAIGRLKHFDYGTDRSGAERVTLLWMDFEEERVGRQQRQVFADRIAELREHGVLKDGDIWTPIKLKTEPIYKFNIGRVRCKVIRQQFPVVPAEAVTIHKAQGGTFSNVVLHLPNSSQTPCRSGELYVGCSRVRQFSNLYIVGAFPEKPPVDDQVEIEYTRLNLESNRFHIQLPMCQEQPLANHFQIVAHNVEGLTQQSWNSMMADEGFSRAQILLLTGIQEAAAEVHVSNLYNWDEKNFTVIHEIPANANSRMGGSCVAIKRDLQEQWQVVDSDYQNFGDHSRGSGERMEITILQHVGQAPAYIVSVFKSPNYPVDSLLTFLQRKITSEMRKAKLLVVGDMGTDLMVLEEGGGRGTGAEMLYDFLKNDLNLENLLDLQLFENETPEDESLPFFPLTNTLTGEHVDLAFAKEEDSQVDQAERSTQSSETTLLDADTYMSATSNHTPIFVHM